jgi:hypothetical protein
MFDSLFSAYAEYGYLPEIKRPVILTQIHHFSP